MTHLCTGNSNGKENQAKIKRPKKNLYINKLDLFTLIPT